MRIPTSKTAAWVTGALALIVTLAWLTPAGMAGQTWNGWLAAVTGWVLTLAFAAIAWRAWPKASRMHPLTQAVQGATMPRKKESRNPLVEDNAAADARASELPDQPQEHIIRGYGAVNPAEGPLDEDRPH